MKKKLIFLFGIIIFSIFFVSTKETSALDCIYKYQDPNDPNNVCVSDAGGMSCGVPLYWTCSGCSVGEKEICKYESELICGFQNCGPIESCDCELLPSCSINSFTADNSIIAYNTGTTLRFSLSDIFPWTISLLSGSVSPTPNSGTDSGSAAATNNLTTTHSYRLNCNSGQAIRDLTVVVSPLTCDGQPVGSTKNCGSGVCLGTHTCLSTGFWTTTCSSSGLLCASATDCKNASLCDTDGACPAPTNKSDGTICNDSNACTTGDVCSGGTCSGPTAVVCNDSNTCTNDTCNTSTGCVYTNNSNACNDNNACTQTDACSGGVCVGSNPVVCTALGQCYNVGTCNTSTGVCSNPPKASGIVCNDSNVCTNPDTCNGSGACISGPYICACVPGTECLAATQCQNASICTVLGVCPARTNKIINTACNDGDVCTDPDKCDGLGACISGPYICAVPFIDLTADAPFPNPDTATVGVAKTFTAVIRNIGTASTGVGFNNFFQVADSSGTVSALSVNALGALAAGGSSPINSSSYTFPSSGTYSVRVCADNNASWVGTITESDEGNNCGGWTNVTVSPTPSATVSISAANTNLPNPNTGTTLSWSYSNADSCTITPPASIGSYPSNSDSVPTGSLAVSKTYEISCDPGSAYASVTVNVAAQPKNLVVVKAGQGTVMGTYLPAVPVQTNIDCGPISGCQAQYTSGTIIILTETPNLGRIFTGWSGVTCDEGNQRSQTCTFTLNSDSIIYANFAVDPNYKEF